MTFFFLLLQPLKTPAGNGPLKGKKEKVLEGYRLGRVQGASESRRGWRWFGGGLKKKMERADDVI